MSAAQTTQFADNIETDIVNILFVGRLEHRKGIDVLLSALPMVLAKHSQVRFRIVGDDSLPIPGETQTYKQEYLATEGATRWPGRVKFEGRVDDKTLRDAYATCDIFVAPSRFESFGLVFLEAMREAKPVIGCQAGGMPEVVSDMINGLLVQPGDVGALVQALFRLIESRELRRKMGDAGRMIFCEKFTPSRLVQASLQLYELAQGNFAKATP
jgi:glycosyltransferase involved in cell wall biosynthesis